MSMRPWKSGIVGAVLVLTVFTAWLPAAGPALPRILAVGDSITEGGTTFHNYRYTLWEMLLAGGHAVEFVGSRSSDTRGGPLRHEGYGGKNAEFVASILKTSFPRNPADILLIHSGHNHEAHEKPVAGIVAAHESMIRTARETNPRVTVLVAQVIPSGKLPKYSYIPELNQSLARMVKKWDRPESRVIAVDMAAGFDWRTDTIDDRVHPNQQGAAKMAARWHEALLKVLPPRDPVAMPEKVKYKQAGPAELKLHIFRPAKNRNQQAAPAIVFFFGGGWKHGTPVQFYPECRHFAQLGFVAISAEYRISSVHGTTPFDAVADGKSAIRWIRSHAADLGVDPDRIVGAGASAGGQVAAAAALVTGLDDPRDKPAVSPRPDALLLWYPVIDNGPDGYGPPEVKARYKEFSPFHQDLEKAPPTLILLGTRDAYLSTKRAGEFQNAMRAAGRQCEVKWFEGAVHPIYPYRLGDSPLRKVALDAADAFLIRHGIIGRGNKR